MTFSEQDGEGVLRPHDDALVITAQIANYWTRRVLIDNGSSADVLFWEAFSKMGIAPEQLGPAPTPFRGFTGDTIQPIGAITLFVLLGTSPKISSLMVDFLIVEAPTSYNAILGRPSLNQMKAATSTYYLKIKFLTHFKIGEIRSEQQTARECYVWEMKTKAIPVQTIDQEEGEIDSQPPPKLTELDKEVSDEETLRQAEPNESTILISVDPKEPKKTVRIGSKMTSELGETMRKLLTEHRDVFKWSHEEMPGIDRKVIEHCLSVSPEARKVKKKRQNFSAEKYAAIAEEVERLLTVGFIREVHYPEWLSNVVLVKKVNGK